MPRRCILRCGAAALPELDLCLACSHAELAKRGRKRKRKAARNPMPTISINAKKYAAMQREAKRRGWTLRQLVETALEGVV